MLQHKIAGPFDRNFNFMEIVKDSFEFNVDLGSLCHNFLARQTIHL